MIAIGLPTARTRTTVNETIEIFTSERGGRVEIRVHPVLELYGVTGIIFRDPFVEQDGALS